MLLQVQFQISYLNGYTYSMILMGFLNTFQNLLPVFLALLDFLFAGHNQTKKKNIFSFSYFYNWILS